MPARSLFFLLLATTAVNAASDVAANICSQACVHLVLPKENMTKDEEQRFNVASNNGYRCAAKCHNVFKAGDSEASVITKLREIPFDDIYNKPVSVPATVALDEQVKQLTKRVEQLEKFVIRLSAIARIHGEEQDSPKYLPLWRRTPKRGETTTTVQTTTGKTVVASSNQKGDQLQHSPEVAGPQPILANPEGEQPIQHSPGAGGPVLISPVKPQPIVVDAPAVVGPQPVVLPDPILADPRVARSLPAPLIHPPQLMLENRSPYNDLTLERYKAALAEQAAKREENEETKNQ